MKKVIGLLSVLILASFAVGCSGGGSGGNTDKPSSEPIPETPFAGQVIVWDDPEVEDAVRAALDKPEGNITGEEAAMVKSILLPESDLWDLRDFKYLVGLEELDVSGNNLRDLHGLEGLSNLHALNVSENHLRDLSPLAGLSKLKELALEKNLVEDIAPLSGLTSLRSLDLSENRITDISPLSSLSALEELDLSTVNPDNEDANTQTDTTDTLSEYLLNDPETLEPLSNLNQLRILCLDGLPLTDLSSISENTSIQVLSARYMPSLEFGTGVFPKNLEELDLTGTKLSTTEHLGQLTSLKKLKAPFMAASYEFLKNLTSLTELKVYKDSVTDPEPFAGLTNLEVFNATCFSQYECDPKEVCDILSGMKELRVLHCGSAYFDALPSLTKLEEVHTFIQEEYDDNGELKSNSDNLALIAQLPNLRILEVSGNDAPLDFSLLNGSNLETLRVRNCYDIEDISPLAQLGNLKELKFESTYLHDVDIAVLSSCPSLKKLTLSECGLETLPTFPKSDSPLEELVLDYNPLVNVGDLSAFAQLRTLSLQESELKDISGAAGLSQLEELVISDTYGYAEPEYYDLSPLAGLTKLQKLHLPACGDMSFLTNLTDLWDLKLNCGPNAQDLTPLAGLTKLETLTLNRCKSESALPDLSNLKNLRILNLHHPSENIWTDLSGIKGLPAVEDVRIYGVDPFYSGEEIPKTPIDLNSLSTLPQLKKLSIDCVTVPDPAPLAALPRLRELDFYECPMPEHVVFTGPASLRRLEGHGSSPQDMTALTGLRSTHFSVDNANPSYEPINQFPNLTELELYVGSVGNEGTLSSESLKKLTVHQYGNDFAFLRGLTNLEELDVSDTAVGDLSAFSSLVSLKELNANAFHRLDKFDMPIDENGVPYPKIQDLSPLSGLTELEKLDLDYNRISDLSPLKNLAKLRCLYVDCNALSDLSSLAPMPGLRVLSAVSGADERKNPDRTYVSSVSGFEGMTGLCYLNIHWNRITDVAPLANLTRLRVLKLYSEYHFAGIPDPSPLLGLTRIEDGDLKVTTRAQADMIEKNLVNVICKSAEDPW